MSAEDLGKRLLGEIEEERLDEVSFIFLQLCLPFESRRIYASCICFDQQNH